MPGWWIAALAALAVAVLAGVADRLRRGRRDLDRIGIVDWVSVQMLALLAAAGCAAMAWHG